MKAVEANFLKFIQNRNQFIIPIYQRTYSWTIDQCEQLWNDIVRVATHNEVPAHFIGSIVYIQNDVYQTSQIPRLMVIDGQQRIVTITLLLCAIKKHLQDHPSEESPPPQKILNYYLINPEENSDLRYKVILTQTDRDTIKNIVDEIPAETSNKSLHVTENYAYFRSKLEKQTISIEKLFQGIQKLMIVDISLDKSHDDPQLIFESLNSMGLELSQADLIRNFILMGQESDLQTRLYNTYWYPMEQDFGQVGYTEWFDGFMRDYLTLKSPSGNIPRINEVYQEFKKYYSTKVEPTMEEVVSDIFTYSQYYTKFVLDKEPDEDIRRILKDILTLRVDVAYPLLLEFYDEYKKNKLTKQDLLELLTLIESYVYRRVICGIPTNSLNKTFATFSRNVDRDNFVNGIKAKFATLDSYRRFPADEEFKQALLVRDVYNLRSRNYLLGKLENFNRKEKVNVDTYTIEHIMPQNENVSPQWQKELGEQWKEIHTKYLHTIGNLTLTGYNPELSDRPFIEKRDMKGGFADSPIRLNETLAKKQVWNEQEIISRAKEIADLSVNVWPKLSIPADEVEKYKSKFILKETPIFTLESHTDNLDPNILELFQQLRRRILNLDSSVIEEVKKIYVAYKISTNFVDIEPRKNKLILWLNIDFSEITDPRGVCIDVSNIGHHGNGDVQIEISDLKDIEYVMDLVGQSFLKHCDDEFGNETGR